MKKTLLFAATFAILNQASAGYSYLNCEAYRISQDTNENVQIFRVNQNLGVQINGVQLDESNWLTGSLAELSPVHPAIATYSSRDGMGDYNIVLTVQSIVSSTYGHLDIGRDHDFDVYKVLAQVSRNGKMHEFVGTCTHELLTTCGGACAPESEIRDVLQAKFNKLIK